MAETRVTFDSEYQFCWVKNNGSGDCYISDRPNIQAEAEGVAYLPAGEATLITMTGRDLYIVGDTVVECKAQNFAECPYDGGGSGGGEEPTLITKTVTTNGTYDASDDDADGYSSVTVDVRPRPPVSDYETLEYVIVPSNSSGSGFALKNYVSVVDDIIECVSVPFIGSGRMFYVWGYNQWGYPRFYNGNIYVEIRNACVTDLIGTRAITLGTEYPTRVNVNNASCAVEVGCTTDPGCMLLGEVKITRLIQPQTGAATERKTIIDLIPSRRKSDNAVGMYDAINDVFYISESLVPFAKHYYEVQSGDTSLTVTIADEPEAGETISWEIYADNDTSAIATGTSPSTETISLSGVKVVSVVGVNNVTFTAE